MKNSKLISFLCKSPNPIVYESVFVAINLSAFLYSIYLGLKWYEAVLMFGIGIFAWVFVEYLVHRFVFHYKSKNPSIRKLVYAMHGVHHAHAHDHNKMYVPLFIAILIAIGQLIVYYTFFGTAGFAVLAGAASMHQFYNFVHLAIHTDAMPNNRILKRLRDNHIKHHNGFGEKCFGVTSTIFDRIFNTL